MRLFVGVFLSLVTVAARAEEPSNSYRIQPPDYSLEEYPNLVGNKFLQPMMWIKAGSEGGVRRTPPNELVHNEVERRQASGWRPFQFYIALHGLPVPQLRWVRSDTPHSLSREQAISTLTDHFLADPGVASAQIARDMATAYVDKYYRFQWRLIRRPMRPSANDAMVACWAKQRNVVEMFMQRFAFSPLHDAYLKSNAGPLNPWINIQHVWLPGSKAGHIRGQKADVKNGTITIVPRDVDKGVNCDVASVSEIWDAVYRVLAAAVAGEAHPDRGLPGDMASPMFGLKVLAGSRPYLSEEHKNACIILSYYNWYKAWFDIHPREYHVFYNDKVVKYVHSYQKSHPGFDGRDCN